MSGKEKISLVALTLLNIAAVLSIVNFPDQAEYGYGVIFYLIYAAVFFLVPCAITANELANAFPEEGGLYLWGKLSFGPRWGVVTLFFQWFNTFPLYGTILTFVGCCIAYIFNPPLSESPLFIYSMIVIILWSCTFVNLFGVKIYAILGSLTSVLGTLIPSLLIIGIAVSYFGYGFPAAIEFNYKDLLPDFTGLNEWMFLGGLMVSMAGIDMTALHITEVEKRKRNYSLALWFAVPIIILISLAGALSIALVVTPEELSTAAGVPEALEIMLEKLNLAFLTPVITMLLALGGISTVFIWLMGPARGILQVANDGYMPKFFCKVNSNDVPQRILIFQSLAASLLASVVFFMPTVSGAFYFLMAMTAELYMTMYVLMFIFGIKLRLMHPDEKTPFRLSKKYFLLSSVIGIVSALTAIFGSFIPPETIRNKGAAACFEYIFILSGALLIVLILIGMVVFWRRSTVAHLVKHWFSD